MSLLGQPAWYWAIFAVCALILAAVPILAWLETREMNQRWGYLDEPFDPSREWLPPADDSAAEWEERLTL